MPKPAVTNHRSGAARRIVVYDTTLRDGAQGLAVSFSASDKVRIARVLDGLGFDYVEGGFPGSNPKDEELFASLLAKPLNHAQLAAFGATRRAGGTCEDDANLSSLVKSGAGVWTLVGKSDPWQVTTVLQTTTAENLNMVRDSVAYGVSLGREVIFDAEHFFDGVARDAEYALEVCLAAARAGAAWIVLCDTNGGSLPAEIRRGVEAVKRSLGEVDRPVGVGIHCHNDCELAVANSLEGVMAGANMVQGTINGYGERCGNANLVSVVANLVLKLGLEALPAGASSGFTELSRTVAEIANLELPLQQPFVGHGAFAHKGGQHVAAVLRHADSYQHIDPSVVGNQPRVLVSELSGRGNVLAKAREFGLELDRDDPHTQWLVQHLKELEHRGYSYEAADASFQMLLQRLEPGYEAPWRVADFTTMVRKDGGTVHAEATVKVEVAGTIYHTAASGNGPVNALDAALRKALSPRFPGLKDVSLHDYKVRILDGAAGTAATTRVLIESGRGLKRWTTVGCSSNIIEASLEALVDSMEYAQFTIGKGRSGNVRTPKAAGKS
ncbi:MAG: citramalate synthase [Candidatus Dormibacteraeota bacterium]|nr:citramalate synthase [Candidatus Dormibacteraeota bacterium]